MDRQLDAAWSAFHGWLSAWVKLPLDLAAAQREQAQGVLGDLFDEGLKFTQAAWRQEWTESEGRLERIAQKGHEAVVTQLGGEPILEVLRATHAAYGDMLGITKDRPEAAIPPAVRAPHLALLAALRLYVLRVAGLADADDPASGKLVRKLLAPLQG
jgi:hypothetical protein